MFPLLSPDPLTNSVLVSILHKNHSIWARGVTIGDAMEQLKQEIRDARLFDEDNPIADWVFVRAHATSEEEAVLAKHRDTAEELRQLKARFEAMCKLYNAAVEPEEFMKLQAEEVRKERTQRLNTEAQLDRLGRDYDILKSRLKEPA